MISKLTLATLVVGGASAQDVITIPDLTYSESEHRMADCYECVAKGFKYCALETTYGRHDTISKNRCFAKEASCPSGTEIYVGSEQNPEVVIAQCPTLKSVCGDPDISSYAQWTKIQDTDSGMFTVSTPDGLEPGEGCTYGFRTSCGAPIVWTDFEYDGHFSIEANLVIIHYTGDGRLTYAKNSDGGDTWYPDPNMKAHQTAHSCVEEGYFACSKFGAPNHSWKVPRIHGSLIIELEDYLEQSEGYRNRAYEYIKASDQAIEDFPWWKEWFGWIWGEKEPTFPEFIGNYEGKVWEEYESLGGWGDLSVQRLFSGGGYYEYGTNWPPTNDRKSYGDGFNSIDINPESCVPRYAVVMMYNSEEFDRQSKNSTHLKATSWPLADWNIMFQNPTPTNYAGADSLKVAAAVAGTVLFFLS